MRRFLPLILCFALIIPCVLISCGDPKQNADSTPLPELTDPGTTEQPTEKPTEKPNNDKNNDKEDDNMPKAFPKKTLYVNGTPTLSISVSAGDTPAEQYGASEMLKYFEKVKIAARDDGYPIALSIDESLGLDAYTTDISSEGVKIVGGNGRGVL